MSASDFLPARVTLETLRAAAKDCRGCPLYRDATQTVFGRGRASSRLLIVGEQPGNEEDLSGEPFVGPAGRILNEALAAVGVDRARAYVTNTVKHFKWTARGNRRLHQKPGATEVNACLPWLEKEIEVIRPEVLLCLGATAAQALLGRDFRVSVQRGLVMPTGYANHAVATIHPSAILRQRTPAERKKELAQFTGDLGVVAKLLRTDP
jgi:DNA polymerase